MVGGAAAPDAPVAQGFGDMTRRNRGYLQQGRAMANTSGPAWSRPSAEDFAAVLKGPDNTLKRLAQQFVAAGVAPVSDEFARQVSSDPQAVQGFVNQHNLADYQRLAGDAGDEQTAGLIAQGDPAGIAALEALRKRLGI